MPRLEEIRDEGYTTALELDLPHTLSLSPPSSPTMLAAPKYRIPLPSPSMAPLPEFALLACPEPAPLPPPTAPPKKDDGPHVKIVTPRRELAELRELRHVKDIKERHNRRRTARKLDSVDSYAAYMADESSVDSYPEGWERQKVEAKGKGKQRAVELPVAWRGTHV